MRRLFALTAAGLALAGAAAAASGVEGTYTTNITRAPQQFIDGPWQVTFKGGKTTTLQFGTLAASGHYSVTGSKITFSHETGKYGCGRVVGVYRWSLRAKLLTLKALSDRCAGRKLVLTEHPLRKIR